MSHRSARARAGVLALLALAAAGAAAAEDFVACAHNKPGDAGLRVRVQAAFDNNPNTLALQRMLGRPETPVSGTADDVDLLAWCQCVHRRRVVELGEEIAVSMASLEPERAARYREWTMRLDPAGQRDHIAFLFTSEAVCIHESKK